MNKKTIFAVLLSLALSISGFASIFVFGSFSNNYWKESICNYSANIARFNTDKNLYSINIGTTDDSGPLLQTDHEFYNLYGIFKQKKITFAASINSSKMHNINIKGVSTESLSLLYVGPVGTVEYNNHYKHYVYPVEMMFEDTRKSYDICPYLVYISKTHADKLLEQRGTLKKEGETFSSEDYKSLLLDKILFSIDDNEDTEFIIENIYYETGYYVDGLNEVMGDFVIVSYYLPFDLRTEQQHMFFMSDYEYQNQYFFNYINDNYSSKKYAVSVNHYNINGSIDDSFLLDFYYQTNNSKDDFFFVFMCILGILLISGSLFFIETSRLGFGVSTVIVGLETIIPFSIFYFIFRFTNNYSLFSFTSCRINLYLSISLLFFHLVIILTNKYLLKRNNHANVKDCE